jgi:undecaprenyl-diphosphatase
MDEKLLLLINRQWTGPALDRAMAAASSFDAWAPLIAVLVLVLLVRGDFKMRAFLITAGLLVGVSDGVIGKSLKALIDRPRPHQSHNDVRIVDLAKATPRLVAFFKPPVVKLSRISFEDVEGRSFPSSHTMNTLAVALAGAAFYGRRAWWLFGLAGIVAYSRIYTGSHWPSDIVTSLFLGAGSSLLLLALFDLAWRKRGAALLPRIHAQHPALFA